MGNTAEIVSYAPGAIGRIVELHGTYYAENWNLPPSFEMRIAEQLGALMARLNPESDGAWFARVDGETVGGIFIDGIHADEEGAKLRFFILDPAYHGHGIGALLMDAAMDFCKTKRFKRVYLDTFKGLDAAQYLYRKHGFVLCGEEDGTALTGNPALKQLIFEWLLQD